MRVDVSTRTEPRVSAEPDSPATRQKLSAGRLLVDRYRIVALLGRGGMGEVYRADDLKLRCQVALKFPPAHLGDDASVRAQFLHEARLARRITHPSVCRVFDIGEADGLPFISMEFIDGEDLESLLHRVGRVPDHRARQLAREFCRGLDAFHALGILHRDIKPANLMVDGQGRGRITDFGISRPASDPTTSTAGTPAYLAPEVQAGGRPSIASDLYSLGLVLAQLFSEKSPREVEHSDFSDPEIGEIISSCLAPKASDRPASARLVSEAFRAREEGLDQPCDTTLSVLPGDLDADHQWLSEQLAAHEGAIDKAGETWELQFDRPETAARFGMELCYAADGSRRSRQPRVGIALAENALSPSTKNATAVRKKAGASVTGKSLACHLASLAEPGQILLTHGAFERLQERFVFSRSDDTLARWQALGTYEIDGLDEPLRIFGIGDREPSSIELSHNGTRIQRRMVDSEIFGWRPAPHQPIPRRTDWFLDRKLGDGSFGETWLASQRTSGAQRVFKFCFERRHIKRLRKELTLFRLLQEELGQREDINRIVSWNIADAPFFLESEYVPGGSLVQWVDHQGGLAQVELGTRLELLARVCDAVNAAHSIGILHKALRPSNILIEPTAQDGPRVQLADFSSGELLEEQGSIDSTTSSSTIDATSNSNTGTHPNLAPEILSGDDATPQSDIYALGVLLFQLVVEDFESRPASGWQRRISNRLLATDIAAAIEGDPSRRYAKAETLASRLRSLPRRRFFRHCSRLIGGFAGIGLVTGLVLTGQRLSEQNTLHNRNLELQSIAGEWMDRDPTKAAAVLLEIEATERSDSTSSRISRALNQDLALVELVAHDRRVDSLETHPDGRHFLSSSWGETKIWRLERTRRGARLITTLASGDSTLRAQWGPEGQRILVSSDNGLVELWKFDAQTGEISETSRNLEGHAGPTSAHFSEQPNGSIVTYSAGDGVRVWNGDGTGAGRDGKALLLQHPGAVVDASFDPTGTFLATLSVDDRLRVWGPLSDNTVSGTTEHQSEFSSAIPSSRGLALQWSPTGKRLATAGIDGAIEIWNWLAEDRRLEQSHKLVGHAGPVVDLVWSHGGTELLTTSLDQTARLWFGRNFVESVELGGQEIPISRIDISPDDAGVLATSLAGEIYLWSLPDLLEGHDPAHSVRTLRGHLSNSTASAWTPESRTLISGDRDGRLRVWDLHERVGPVVLRGHEGWVYRVEFSPDRQRIATTSNDRTIRLWDLESSDRVNDPRILEHRGATFFDAAWSPDGHLVAAASEDGSVVLWSGQRLEVSERLEGHGGTVWDVSFSPDGRYLASASQDMTARIWDLDQRSSDPIILSGHRGRVFGVAWSPDGHRLATVSRDGSVRLWSRLDPNVAPIELGRFPDELYRVDWSPDGHRLVVATNDGVAVVIDLANPSNRVRLEGHSGAVYTARFSPDGQRIVTASFDSTARIWSADGRGEATILRGHDGPLSDADWSPDGSSIVTASQDLTARIWSADTIDPVAELRARTSLCLSPKFRVEELGEEPDRAKQRFESCQRSHRQLVAALAE